MSACEYKLGEESSFLGEIPKESALDPEESGNY